MQRNINYKNLLIVLFYLTSVFSLENKIKKLKDNTKINTAHNQSAENQLRYDVPDDCRFYILSEKAISLICNLRTINSEYDTTNFSVIPPEHTVELNIICNNDIITKSYLASKSFSHLTQLRTLTIKYCKISKIFPDILFGLNNLKNLSIQTHNNNWADFNLDLERDSFNSTGNLERLDLSKNNIWTLPQNIFCLINSLSFLNISENCLQDINELGFRDKNKEENNKLFNASIESKCSLDLEILDMSFNNFVLLPANGFGVLKRLNQLKINNNEISMIADTALSGLKNLEILNLSSNKIVALPSELFFDCSLSIKEVYLQNNSISLMSPKLFSNLEQLQALDLSFNQITSTWIDKNTFIGLIRLVLLDLSHNKITKLQPEFFLDLYTLQILNLRHNQLYNIIANTFSLMNNLHTLLLSYNNLKYLDEFSLNGLYVLSLLSIDNNQLYNIHPDAFRNCSSLQDVNLNGNNLTSIPSVLRNLRLLRTIDLGENKISTISNRAFSGLHNLYGLRLIGNNLQNITVTMFHDLISLQILNLAHNEINLIESTPFASTPSIQAIRLDGNQIQDIGDIFVQIPSLLWLNISDNKLKNFDYSQIPNCLQWLDIHKNYLNELSNLNPYINQIRLQTLDASFNQIQNLTPHSIPNTIELLFLNDNAITTVEPNVFLEKTNLTRVDLYANHLTTLDIKSFRILPVSNDKLLPEFYIGGNPFICDCNIEWLQKINLLTTRNYPKIMDLDTIYCTLLNNREQMFVSLVNAKSKHFLCSYKTHCFALCHCCDFDACDCEMTCPNNCTCFHDESWSTNIVECSSAAYTEIPNNIPMDTTELYLDGNDLIELSGHSFIGRKNLLVLFSNNSNIENIYNTTFSGLKRLLKLHLEQNKISRLHGNEFHNLENLKYLFLQNNKITYIENGTFLKLEMLEILRLDGNKLIQFEIWQLSQNIYLIEIGLSGNVWSCECSYLSRFRNYLQINSDKIIDAKHVACIYNNMSGILKEKNGTKCTLREGLSTYVRTSKIENLLPLLLVGTCTFIGFFGVILGIFCYRQEINTLAQSSWLYKLCFKSTVYIENCNKDKFYDAYIAYSLQDESFVNQILADTLENDIGYKLSLHYRDLNLNLYITDAITEAVDSSKQVILVLSKNFLYNEWSRFEYKSALHEIINKQIKLIFILYGDLPQRAIDIDMRHYLKMNTCIEWHDKNFWQKLRLALPHLVPRPCSKTHSNLNIYGSSSAYNMERGNTTPHYDCRHIPRISSCSKNYRNNFETIGCKYNSVHNKNVLRINAIEKTDEYGVPLNYRIADTSTYNVNLDEKKNYAEDCTFYLMSKYTSVPEKKRQIKLIETKNANSDNSVCNLSINGSTSSGSINAEVNIVSCINASDCNYSNHSKYSNDSEETKTNKIIETLWS